MSKKIIFICYSLALISVITLLCSTMYCKEANLPNAPQGFSWKWCKNIKAYFLLPDGWFFKEETKEGTEAVFITKESIDKEVMYKTGFSANVIQKASKKINMPPSQYAKQTIENMKKITQWDDIHPVSGGSGIKGYGGFFRSKTPIGPIIQHTMLLGNDKTGTYYLFTFESTESSWDNAWKIGKVIMDNLALETEF